MDKEQRTPHIFAADNERMAANQLRRVWRFAAKPSRPRYKLVARVTMAGFRDMIASVDLTTTEWGRFYVRPGNTVSVSHASATLALFSYGNAVFLCTPVPE